MTINDQIPVANISCDGCVRTITRQLIELAGITEVQVDKTTGSVSVTHTEIIDRKKIVDQLMAIGYPEKHIDDNAESQLKNF